jgi:hypothetical protein
MALHSYKCISMSSGGSTHRKERFFFPTMVNFCHSLTEGGMSPPPRVPLAQQWQDAQPKDMHLRPPGLPASRPSIPDYRRTSISGTTFSGKKCLSGSIFHAI